MDIKTLGLALDTAGIERGLVKIEAIPPAADRAEAAAERLGAAAKEAGESVAEMGAAAQEAAHGMSAVEATTRALAESEEDATRRVRDMVRASLDRQQAMLAAAAATRSASQATRELSQSQSTGRTDSMGNSFAESQQELEALSDAMAHQAQSLDDIGERRGWVTELYERGLISVADSEAHMKSLDRQEKELTRSIEAHAREVEHLLRTYDPASAALAKITEDEKRLAEALRSGAISAEQHAKAKAGLNVGRAKWQAEAEGIKETAKQINYLALTSTSAFRDYATLASALSRGDFQLASNQILQLSSRAGALRMLLTPIAAGFGAVAVAAGAMAVAFHQGQRESFELQKNLILSGNAAGATAGQLGQMAERLSEIVSTRGAASDVLGQLAATGRVASEDLEHFAEATLLLERNTGQAREEIVRTFTDLGKAPVEASFRLNEQMHHLTQEIKDQIVELQARGDFEAAGALAQRAYADAATDAARRVGEQLPLLDRAAKATTGVFAKMWDAIKGVGRQDTMEDELQSLQDARGDRPLFGGRAQFDIALFNADTREEKLARSIEEQRASAQEDARRKRELQEQIRTQTESAARVQSQKAIADAESNARAAAIQRELNDTLAQYSAYESELEALRDAGLVSETDYYNEKRRLIEQNRDANIEALKFENQRLAAESARSRSTAASLKGIAKSPAEVAQLESQAQTQIIGNQAKIADNEAKIANLRGDAISQINVLTNQQEAAGKALARSYEDARAAAQAYLGLLTRQQDRELASFGQGDRSRERDDTRNRIDDRFAEQRQQLESDRRTNPKMTQEQYDQELAVINEFHQRALDSDSRYWTQRKEIEGNFWVGAQEAMSNYIHDARNVAAQSEQLFTNAFEGMTDALVQFAMTGKGDFNSLANSIIADLLRIRIQAAAVSVMGGGNWLSALAGIFGAGTSSSNAATALAGGNFSGPRYAEGTDYVPRDQIALVHKGERIIPARFNQPGSMRGFGATSMTFQTTINANSGTNVAQLHAALDQRDQQLEARIAENLKTGRWAALTG